MTPLIDISLSSPLWRKARHLRRLALSCVEEACAATGLAMPAGAEFESALVR